jgi:hypothetical protein
MFPHSTQEKILASAPKILFLILQKLNTLLNGAEITKVLQKIQYFQLKRQKNWNFPSKTEILA